MQKQPSEGFYKKGIMRNFTKFTENHQVFPCEFCEICKNTFFAEHFRTTASDYSSINKNSEGAIRTVNYNTEIKAH